MAAFIGTHLSKPVQNWLEVWHQSVKAALLQIGLQWFC